MKSVPSIAQTLNRWKPSVVNAGFSSRVLKNPASLAGLPGHTAKPMAMDGHVSQISVTIISPGVN